MLPEVVWNMPELGTFNVHAALLPQYRGAAPINWAIIGGEIETGVTTFFLDHDIDTGRIILQHPYPISDEANVEEVYDGLMRLGADACIETLQRIVEADGHPQSIEQELLAKGELHTAPKLFKENCQIDWRQSAKRVYDFVRGLSPIPGAWTQDSEGHIYKMYATAKTVLNAQAEPGTVVADRKHMYVCCSDLMLEIKELQPAGKKRMEAQAFLNGSRNMVETLHFDPTPNT
jgi:methionyl-tRNA formyltransferase